MKKLITFSIFLAIISAIYLIFYSDNKTLTISKTTSLSNSKKEIKVKDKSVTLNQLSQQKINVKIKKIAPILIPACDSAITDLLESSGDDIFLNGESFFLNIKETNCRNILNTALKSSPTGQKLFEKCLNRISEECKPIISFLKSWAVSVTYPDNTNLAPYDEIILANKISYTLIMNPTLPLETVNLTIKLLEEIILKNPEMKGAQKAKLIFQFLKENRVGLGDEEDFKKTTKAIDSFSADPTMAEVNILRLFKPLEYKNELTLRINQYIERNPTDYKGPYYHAAREWTSNNPKASMAWLQKANSLSPNNPHILETIKRFESAKTTKEIVFWYNITPPNILEI